MYKQLIKASLAVSSLVAVTAFAAPDTYNLDSTHTFPRFSWNHLGFSTYQAQFDKTEGTIVLDRAAKTGSIDIKIDATSLDAGSEKFEEHLKSADFFDVTNYPTATFKSTSVKFDGPNPVSANGDLTIHGVTKPITLTINNLNCGQHFMLKKEDCGAQVTGTLKRSDFGLGKYTPMVSDDVTLTIEVEAIKN